MYDYCHIYAIRIKYEPKKLINSTMFFTLCSYSKKAAEFIFMLKNNTL